MLIPRIGLHSVELSSLVFLLLFALELGTGKKRAKHHCPQNGCGFGHSLSLSVADAELTHSKTLSLTGSGDGDRRDPVCTSGVEPEILAAHITLHALSQRLGDAAEGCYGNIEHKRCQGVRLHDQI
jgi:hypothetical protein